MPTPSFHFRLSHGGGDNSNIVSFPLCQSISLSSISPFAGFFFLPPFVWQHSFEHCAVISSPQWRFCWFKGKTGRWKCLQWKLWLSSKQDATSCRHSCGMKQFASSQCRTENCTKLSLQLLIFRTQQLGKSLREDSTSQGCNQKGSIC